MIPIDQSVLRPPTDLSGPPGDCFAACIASILELPLKAVPRPGVEDRYDWDKPGGYWERIGLWLCHEQGFYILETPGPHQPFVTSMSANLREEYWIACGPGPRGCNHCVVVQGTTMVHDPHPSREGLLRDAEGNQCVEWWSTLVYAFPWRVTPQALRRTF